MIEIRIPLKLPSLNEYINECRKNRYAGASMKKRCEEAIGLYVNRLPRLKKPVKIHFVWVEGNHKRDYDNICFAKKFILDTLVKCGKLEDDNRKNVNGFTDSFVYDKDWCVILRIEEQKYD